MGNRSPKSSSEDYLENLALSQDEKDKIAALAATGPAALLAMMRAAPEDFYRYFGRERCAELRERLQESLRPSERAAAFGDSVMHFHATGARLDHAAPSLRPPKYDVAERDRLFEELQRLRRRIAEIEQTLNAMLEASPEPVRVVAQLGSSFVNSIGMEFVLVPAGKFLMGSPKSEANRFEDERPQHEVTIAAPFYLGKYQVTQGEWKAVMGDNPSHFKGDNLPVENVSWDDAQIFVIRLNRRNDGYVYRLPSEAEWEYACRAGTTGDYAGELDAMGWYGENSGLETHPVGEKKPNAWGLYDMHGNVWEWCQDRWHDNYNGAPSDGITWEQGSDNAPRVLRGGSWNDLAYGCRSALRYLSPPGLRYLSYGFRLVAARIS